jgi:hypothetical protein
MLATTSPLPGDALTMASTASRCPRSGRIAIRERRINGAAHNQQLYADAFCTHGNLIADSILVATWNTVRLTFVNKMT